jgi:MFS superfamily sulfate permease-like transporter
MAKSPPLLLLCYMESMAMARKYALANRYEVDANQEMWALGLGCILASFFSGEARA